MEQEVKKRIRRSKEEINKAKIEKLESQIAEWKSKIAVAEKEIEELKNPPVAKKDIWERADELGVTPEEILAFVEKTGKKKNQE